MHDMANTTTRRAFHTFAPLFAPAPLVEASFAQCRRRLAGELLSGHLVRTPETGVPVALYSDGRKVHRGPTRKGKAVFLTLTAPQQAPYDVHSTTTALRLLSECLDARSWCAMAPDTQRWVIGCLLRRVVEEAHQRGGDPQSNLQACVTQEEGRLTIAKLATTKFKLNLQSSKRGVLDPQIVDVVVNELIPADREESIESNRHTMGNDKHPMGNWLCRSTCGVDIALDPSPFRSCPSWVIPGKIDSLGLAELVYAFERGAPNASRVGRSFEHRALAFGTQRFGTEYSIAYMNCMYQGITGTDTEREAAVHAAQKFAVASLGMKQVERLLMPTTCPKVAAVHRLIDDVRNHVLEQTHVADMLSECRMVLEPCELDVFKQQAGLPSTPGGHNFSVAVAKTHNDTLAKDTLQASDKPIEIAALISLPCYRMQTILRGRDDGH